MMKYVCFKNPDLGKEEIFLFPKGVNHDCFAEVGGHIKNQTSGEWHRVRRTLVSAGFVLFIKGEAVCFGNSVTLNLSSRPQDTAVLNQQLND